MQNNRHLRLAPYLISQLNIIIMVLFGNKPLNSFISLYNVNFVFLFQLISNLIKLIRVHEISQNEFLAFFG